jgi:uncharacterized protein
MSAQQNRRSAEDAYRAFGQGDAAGAMQDMDDTVVWTVRGDNSLSGIHEGKEAVARLWGKFAEKGLKTAPHDFVSEKDKVIVLTTVTLDGESDEAADVLTYNEKGKLIAFDQLGDPAIANRVFPQ